MGERSTTGFRYLDEQLGVLRNGQLIAISSRPSVGGDELAREMVECIAGGQDINGVPMTAGHDRKPEGRPDSDDDVGSSRNEGGPDGFVPFDVPVMI